MSKYKPKNFKPMLAGSCENVEDIKFPVLGSPKLDGIRCLIIDGVAMSRALKPIPNKHIQSILGNKKYNGLDGELIIGNNFSETSSAVMSEEGEPDFKYFVFDLISSDKYEERLKHLNKLELNKEYFEITSSEYIEDKEELNSLLQLYLKTGFEGLMIRKPDSPYKFGRSTIKEQYLLKIKPFEDDEAKITGFIEQYENTNKAELNELGYTKRSSKKANLIPKNTLGKLVVFNKKFGEFYIGTGFDDKIRKEIWENKKQYLGKLIKFKYQKYGTIDKPRIPVFIGFRDKRDL